MQTGLCQGAGFIWVGEKRAECGAREGIIPVLRDWFSALYFKSSLVNLEGFVCVGGGVSLPFTVSRNLTLKRLPEKFAGFVFHSLWRSSCKKELCWTIVSSHAVVFQKAAKPECIDVNLLRAILQDLVWFPLKGEDIPTSKHPESENSLKTSSFSLWAAW